MKNIYKNIGIFSISLFVAASAVYLYSPVIGSHADTSTSADINLTVGSALALSTSADSLALEANIGDFTHGSLDVDVVTNSQYGYTLTLEDSDNESSLVHSNTSISDKLTSDFEGAKTSTEMDNNTWGFSLNTTDYFFIPTLGNPAALKRTTSAVSGDYDRTNVDFGAKVGNITSGTYTDTVKFTAYVNGVDGNPADETNGSINVSEPGVISNSGDNSDNEYLMDYDSVTGTCSTDKTLHDITTMQRVSTCICENTTKPNSTATRLDWDGSHHGDDSYVPRTKLVDTRDGSTYIVSKLADGNCWMSQSLALELSDGVSIKASNNDGTIATVAPDNTTQTTIDITWEDNDNHWRSYHPIASESYFQNGITMASSPSSTEDDYDTEKAGNYYNWYAATAGSGTSDMVEADAPSSICPRGWRLPGFSGPRSYATMLSAYGIENNQVGAEALRSTPLNYNLSGDYDSWGYMAFQENTGTYWTSRAANTDTNAINFYVNKKNVYFMASTSSRKGYGNPIRCVAIQINQKRAPLRGFFNAKMVRLPC